MIPEGPLSPQPLATPVTGVHLWLLDLRHEPAPAAWAACQAEEQLQASRFKFTLHARRYRAAHAAMRQVMSAHLGLAPGDWRWRAGVHGKPHHMDARHGHFNLSHTEDWGLLAWHPTLSIGVDIEWRHPLPDLGSLAAHQFTPDEQRWLFEANAGAHVVADADDTRLRRFYRLWAAKEAALKALGSGLLVAPQRVPVDLRTGTCATVIALGAEDGCPPSTLCRLQVHELALPDPMSEPLPTQAALAVLDTVHPGDQAMGW